MWRIPYVNPGAQFVEERAELMPHIEAILAGGMHVGGPEIEALEREIADYVGARHAVALNSGTDALIFGMIAAGVGPGDEVITPPNSFVASTAAIVRAGATPVFADVHAARQDRFDARHQLRLLFDELGSGIHVGDAPHLCHLKIGRIPRCYRRQRKADRATSTDARAT